MNSIAPAISTQADEDKPAAVRAAEAIAEAEMAAAEQAKDLLFVRSLNAPQNFFGSHLQ